MRCNQHGLNGIWRKDRHHVNEITSKFRDETCNVVFENATHFWTNTTYTKCGTQVQESGNYIFYRNVAQVRMVERIGPIERAYNYIYYMTCTFNRHLKTRTGYGRQEDETKINNGTDVYQYGASMKLYETSTFYQPLSPPITVTLSQPIYVEIALNDTHDGLKFVVTDCQAFSSRNKGDNIGYSFFYNKCPLDPYFKLEKYDGKVFQFSINTFRFIEMNEAVYFHCHLFACPLNSTSPSCQQKCGGKSRRRRSSIPVDSPKEIDVISEQISFKKVPSCEDISCPENSVCVDLFPAQCRCKSGYVYHQKRHSCVKERIIRLVNLKLDLPFYDSYYDTSSTDFMKFAIQYEEFLMKQLSHVDEIEGVKIIGLSRGSVVVEVLITYAEVVNENEALEVFTDSLRQFANTTVKTESSNIYKILQLPIALPLNTRDPLQVNTSDPVHLTLYPLAGCLVLVIAISCFIFIRKYSHQRNKDGKEKINYE